MSLINQLFFAVLISSVTSTFLLLVWWMLRGFFMLVNPQIIYVTLRWICLLYLLPIGYVAIILTYRVWFQGQEEAWTLVFSRTEDMIDELRIISVVWCLAAFGLLVYRWLDNLNWCRKFRDNVEITQEEEPEITKTFEEVCDSLDIPTDKLSLQRNIFVNIPMVVGVRHPQVVLPEQDYTVEELRIIFSYELSHYKHKDLQCKILVVIVLVIHCFNPICLGLLQIVNLWSEYMADVSALETSDHLFDARQYFNKIIDLVPDGKKLGRERYLFSTLYKDDNTLARRIDFMKKYQRMKKAGKVVTTALTAAFVMMSTTTIFASGKTVADLHNIIYQNAEGQTEETEQIEYSCDVKDLNFEGLVEETTTTPDDGIAPILEAGVTKTYDWIVNPNTRHVSGAFTVNAGQTISVVATVLPGDKDYWLGIMDHDGHARYIEGRGAAAHNFKITETKSYRVFIQNNYKDGTTLHAKGGYGYQ